MEDGYLIDSDILIDHVRRADLAADLLRAKYGLGFADAIIAASADMESATLVTRNVKHFAKVDHIINIEKPY